MEKQSVQMRAKLLGNYEKSIKYLSQRLSRTKELAPEAKKEIQSRIKLLKKRKRHLEDRYKEIDDMRSAQKWGVSGLACHKNTGAFRDNAPPKPEKRPTFNIVI
jgi:hypothetical protein